MAERDERMIRQLSEAGVDLGDARAALELDAILQRWRRRVNKRELGRRALADLDLSLELPELDALIAIWAPANEFPDEPPGETMVGTVAQRLGIDPSRASRLTSALISRGLVRRVVSQEDSRRTVLEPTEEGDRIVHAVRSHKLLTLGSFLNDWTEDEIRTFVPLLERFSQWSDEMTDVPDDAAREIRRLREELHAANDAVPATV